MEGEGGYTDLCGTLSSAMEFRVEGDIHFRMSTGIAAPTCRNNNLVNSCVAPQQLASWGHEATQQPCAVPLFIKVAYFQSLIKQSPLEPMQEYIRLCSTCTKVYGMYHTWPCSVCRACTIITFNCLASTTSFGSLSNNLKRKKVLK